MEGQTDEWTRVEKIHRMEGRKVGNIRKERNGQMELEERVSPRGLRGQKPDSQSVDECRGYTLVVFLSFFPPIFFLSSCFFYNCLPGRLPPGLLFSSTSSSLCLHSLIPPQSAGWQVDCGHDGRYPFWVRQHFLSVPEARSCSIRVLGPALASSTVCEVQLLCSLTPPTTLVPAVLCLCKLQLTTRPCPLKICTVAVARRPDNI